jgi:hypothetical protein
MERAIIQESADKSDFAFASPSAPEALARLLAEGASTAPAAASWDHDCLSLYRRLWEWESVML